MATVRILSVDGGGIRGILPARLLEAIEVATGQPAADIFHLIAGTSTGGIIGCGLFSGLPAGSLGDLYAERAGDIFAHSFWRTITTVANLDGPKYEPDTLETILKQVLGERLLSQPGGAELLVPSYCIELPVAVSLDGGRVQSTRSPMFFKSWKARGQAMSPGDPAKEAFDFKLRDVARATSAAPTYFPAAHIRNQLKQDFWMVDGGVFANNPAMCALTSAMKIFGPANDYLVVSLGTGSIERKIDGADAAGWGEVAWLHPILSILMDGNADTVCYEMDQVSGVRHYRFEISLGSDPSDPYAVDEDFDDAKPDNIQRLEALAGKLISEEKPRLDPLCAELRKPKDKIPLVANPGAPIA
jgi:patatin-like phospholipase/acyl hydrolase